MTKKQGREQQYLDALRWALGSNGEFPERQPGQGAYYWRMELMRRAGLKWDGEQFQPAGGVAARPVTQQEDQWLHDAAKRASKVVAPGKLAPAAPAPDPARLRPTWQEAEHVRDLPRVDEAIRAFLEDQTGDNSTGMVLAILRSYGVPPSEERSDG